MSTELPAVVDRVVADADGRALAVLLVEADGEPDVAAAEGELVVAADRLDASAGEGTRVRVIVRGAAGIEVVADPEAAAEAGRRRASRRRRLDAIARARPTRRRR